VPIDFGSDQPWGAVSQPECQRMAREAAHPLAYRVYFAALGWANRIGHAEFGQGALGRVLANADSQALKPGSVTNAVNRAKVLGLIASTSRTACLALGDWQFQKDGRGSVDCRTHGIRGFWM
jgi:hypothetical protein